MSVRILQGDCRDVLPTLAANSVHCVVTSPPYYGLRDYGTAQWDGGDAACQHTTAANRDSRPRNGLTGGTATIEAATIQRGDCRCGARRVDRQIGLEASPDEYLATMVAVFREVKRVLRPDGTLWLNIGDSYWNGGGEKRDGGHGFVDGGKVKLSAARGALLQARCNAPGLKPKDLLMMPARLALALQADGWWVRSDIIWAKPNPLPESVTDRPTSAYEHVFLLTKRATYFYDAEAVREEATLPPGSIRTMGTADNPNGHGQFGRIIETGGSRNLRNVWTIATQAFPSAHFATYPAELASRCIRAGTSERGCCAACGAPWVRTTERHSHVSHPQPERSLVTGATRNALGGQKEWSSYVAPTTTGWAASCACAADVVPATVLDPFAGASTTLLVAQRLQRDAIGVELNPDYVTMGRQRIEDEAGLFADVVATPEPQPAPGFAQPDLFSDMAAD